MSLMGGITPKRNNSLISSSPSTPLTPAFNLPSTPKTSLTKEEIPYSPSSWEPLENSLDAWVTVFGFPPSASSYVVSEFSSFGTILQTSIPPSANWMHLKFQTRLQAAKALAKNGTILGSSIMVGVAPVTDPSVLDNLNTTVGSPIENNGVDQSVGNVNNTPGTPRSNVNSSLGTPRSIRPLTQAYKDAQGDYKVLPNTNTPNKESGLVSKAIGAVFGW
jgi:nuclear pore complex protein Nup53